MYFATPQSINDALTVLATKPSPDFCYATRDTTTGEPCLYSMYWRGPHLADCVSIHLQCATASRVALVHGTRVLFLDLSDIFIENKPIGTGDQMFRIAFPEPIGDKVVDDGGELAPIDELATALNAALSVELDLSSVR